MRKDLDLCPVFRIVRHVDICLLKGDLVEGFMEDGVLMVHCTDPHHDPWNPYEFDVEPYNRAARDLLAITNS